MRMSVENGIVAFIVLVVVLELVIEGLEDEDRFAEDEDDYDIAAFTNNSIFSASRTLTLMMNSSMRMIHLPQPLGRLCCGWHQVIILNPEPRNLWNGMPWE